MPWLIFMSPLVLKFFFSSAVPLSLCWETGGPDSPLELIGPLPSASPTIIEHLSHVDRASFLTFQKFFLLSSFPRRIPPFLPLFHVTQGGWPHHLAPRAYTEPRPGCEVTHPPGHSDCFTVGRGPHEANQRELWHVCWKVQTRGASLPHFGESASKTPGESRAEDGDKYFSGITEALDPAIPEALACSHQSFSLKIA